MDDDTNVLPPNHPLRVYLRGLNLDDIDEIDPYDNPPDIEPSKQVIKEPSLFTHIFKYVLWLFCSLDSFPKRLLLDRLIKSGYILNDDRMQLQVYKRELENRNSCHFSYPILLYIIPILSAFLFANFTRLSLLMGIFTGLLFLSNFLFSIIHVILVKYSVSEMEILFSNFIKSVKFLRGLTGVEVGFIFAERGGIGRNQLCKVVLPNLTAKLFDSVKIYTSELLSVSQKINKIIRASDFLSSRLTEISNYCDAAECDLSDALNGEKNLRNVKILLEAVFELNSEVARVLGCFYTAHFSESIAVNLKMVRLLGLWLLSTLRAKRNMRPIEMMQTNLLKGQSSSDESDLIIHESSASSTEDLDVKKMLSALTSLHFNVLAWSLRIHNLREKLATKSKEASLSDLVTGDLEPMRLLLNNCRLCLNEASAVLISESNESSLPQSHKFELLKPGSEEGPIKLISLDSEVTIEYECLEAVVGEDDNQSNCIDDEFYDEFDNSGRPLTKAEMKKRTAERAVLLTELNSVIAHRAVETREREEKALSRVRADPAKQSPIQPSPASQQSESEAVYGSNNGHPSESRLDLKRRTILRFQNFDLLIKPLEPIRSNSEDGSIPCENGDVEVSGLRPPPMSEDLRAMILQRFHGAQASQPADEDVFDDIGTGEDVEELVESEYELS